MKRSLPLLAAIVATLIIGTAQAGAATVVNGDFEAGTSGWTILQDAGGAGSWTTYNGTKIDDYVVPASHGNTATSFQDYISDAVIYQDVALEPGHSHQLSLNFWVRNLVPLWLDSLPATFDVATAVGELQTARIDVIKGSADPLTTNSADILAPIYTPGPSSPTQQDWTPASADLSAFAGQTVRIRTLFAVTEGSIVLGIDDFAITSKDITPPALSGAKLSSSKYTLGAKKQGFNFKLTSDKAGTATITFTKSAKGKKNGKNCAKPSKKLAKKKNCTRWVTVKGSLSLPVVAGANSLKFNGKVGKRKLGAGTYRATVVVTSATGYQSNPVTKTFKVLPKKKN